MSNSEIGSIALTLCLFLGLSHCLGYIFDKLRQPRLIGEILTGVILGPFVLKTLSPHAFEVLSGSGAVGVNKTEIILNFIYWTGLFLLMFTSGSETRRLMARENQKETAWLLTVGVIAPFLLVLILGLQTLLPLSKITGTANQEMSVLLVLCIAVSVTSIPVISRIFYDLKILHTRFASLVLGSAVLEDIILWGVLAVATGIVSTATLAPELIVQKISAHTAITLVYMAIGLFVAPKILKSLHDARFNILIKASPRGYIFFLLFAYISVASILDVNLIFGAFMAGFGIIGGIKGTERKRFEDSLDAIAKVSFSFFIPIYFAIVGYKLVFGKDFSVSMLLAFLIGSSILSIFFKALAAYFAGFRKLDVVNLAITINARGGPGIVLASVAYDAGIINGSFYTTLVITAIITSQIAGSWLRFILGKGLPLLSKNVSIDHHSTQQFDSKAHST